MLFAISFFSGFSKKGVDLVIDEPEAFSHKSKAPRSFERLLSMNPPARRLRGRLDNDGYRVRSTDTASPIGASLDVVLSRRRRGVTQLVPSDSAALPREPTR